MAGGPQIQGGLSTCPISCLLTVAAAPGRLAEGASDRLPHREPLSTLWQKRAPLNEGSFSR